MALTQGWNSTNISTLKGNIDATFNTLAAKTDILDGIYAAVKDCWKGPDADRYLQEVYTRAKELVESCKTAYDGIGTAIDAVETEWKSFQGGE